MLLIQNGKPADTIMEKWGWRAGTPLGRNGMGIPIPIEIGETYRNKKKITRNTIGKKRRAERMERRYPSYQIGHTGNMKEMIPANI